MNAEAVERVAIQLQRVIRSLPGESQDVSFEECVRQVEAALRIPKHKHENVLGRGIHEAYEAELYQDMEHA